MSGRCLGWDMPGALSLGAALGLPAGLLAEMLPAIELAVMTKLNEGRG